MSIQVLQFHIEVQKESFPQKDIVRKDRHDMYDTIQSYCNKHMKARKQLQGPLHAQNTSIISPKNLLIMAPIDSNLQKVSSNVLEYANIGLHWI